MRGHVYKRGETWTAVFDVGEQPRTRCSSCDWKSWGGSARSRCPECREPVEVRRERRQRSKGGFPSKAAAEDHLALRLAEIARGAHVMPNDITVGEYLSRWLEVQRSQLEPSTWVNYRRRIARYFEPALGGIPLQALRVQHLKRLPGPRCPLTSIPVALPDPITQTHPRPSDPPPDHLRTQPPTSFQTPPDLTSLAPHSILHPSAHVDASTR
ncbi:MAG: N-terminal phage integrase SAM-like domain-containing protein [Nitriliruptorales bacterium]|nr:N-terminal phage integrase SAM-like domain-containing protein [Nitriliruptorales bacterium]